MTRLEKLLEERRTLIERAKMREENKARALARARTIHVNGTTIELMPTQEPKQERNAINPNTLKKGDLLFYEECTLLYCERRIDHSTWEFSSPQLHRIRLSGRDIVMLCRL